MSNEILEIVFKESSDSSDCDTCGYNFDSGLTILVNDVLAVDRPAVASCFGGHNISINQGGYQAIADLIEHITGKEVVFTVDY